MGAVVGRSTKAIHFTTNAPPCSYEACACGKRKAVWLGKVNRTIFVLTTNPTMENTKHAIELTDSNFEKLALNSELPVMVDFWAEWCGPCRMIGPSIEEIAKEYEGKAVVGKVNVDTNPQVAMKYGIRSIPTVLILKNGEVVNRAIGAMPKTALEEKLKVAFEENDASESE